MKMRGLISVLLGLSLLLVCLCVHAQEEDINDLLWGTINVETEQCESFDWKDGRHGMDISTHALWKPYGPNGEGYNAESLCELISDLSNQGVRVLAINSAYNDGEFSLNHGFDQWGNMIVWDMHTPSMAFNNSWATFDEVMKCAKNRCMKVISWWNPSYVAPTSPLYTAAEHESYYRFKQKDEEDCQQAVMNGCIMNHNGTVHPEQCYGPDFYVAESDACGCQWVFDQDREKCYASVWGSAPSGDFASEEWTDYLLKVMELYLNHGLDGFVLDAPEMYVGVGAFQEDFVNGLANGNLLYEKLIYPLKQRDPQPVIFGETYGYPFFQRLAGLDGEFTEMAKNYLSDYNRPWDDIFSNLIEWQHPDDLEQFRVFEPQDHSVTYCHLGKRMFDERDDHCPMNILRLIPRLDQGNRGTNRLGRALATGAGYLTDVSMNGDCSDYPGLCQGGREHYQHLNWWKPESYDGQDDDKTLGFLTSVTWADDAGPWAPQALRAPGLYDGSSHYTMLKYDAFNSGRFGVFAANLADEPHGFNLSEALYSDTLRRFAGTEQVLEPVSMAAQDFVFQEFPNQLANWSIADGALPGYSNCFDKDQYQIVLEDGNPQMTLGACLLRCLANEEEECNMVVVEWDEWEDGGLVEGCWANPKTVQELQSNGDCHFYGSEEECKESWGCKYTTLTHSWV